VQLVAISVDAPAVSKKHAAEQGFSFLFLSDEDGKVLREWDLLHEDGHDGHDISRPAEFLIDSSGTVRWANLSDNFMQRIDASDALEAIDQVRAPKP
jgi:peroxiredoxin